MLKVFLGIAIAVAFLYPDTTKTVLNTGVDAGNHAVVYVLKLAQVDKSYF